MRDDYNKELAQHVLDLMWERPEIHYSYADIAGQLEADEGEVLRCLQKLQHFGYVASKIRQRGYTYWNLSSRALSGNLRQIHPLGKHPAVDYSGLKVYRIPSNVRVDPRGDLSRWLVG